MIERIARRLAACFFARPAATAALAPDDAAVKKARILAVAAFGGVFPKFLQAQDADLAAR